MKIYIRGVQHTRMKMMMIDENDDVVPPPSLTGLTSATLGAWKMEDTSHQPLNRP